MSTPFFLFIFASALTGPMQTRDTAAPVQTTGPTEKIGHSVRQPEIQKRIEQLVEQEKAELEAKDNSHAHEARELTGIPTAFVSLGNMLPSYGIVVEKLHHKLSVIEKSAESSYRVIRSYRAITGKKLGDKIARGDLKTPEGVYFTTGRIEGNRLPKKYGVLALTLDYPNIFDRQVRKTGSGIWLHATDKPERLLTPFDTEGCVALSNEDILDLQKYVKEFETPVVITQEMTTVPSTTELKQSKELSLAMIEAWRQSWQSSDFEVYSGFYSDQFRVQGKSKKTWLEYKKGLSFARGGKLEVNIDEPKVVAFEDQLLVMFQQKYHSEDKQDFGKKFLYLKWEGDRYRIVSEKWYPLNKNLQLQTSIDSPAKTNN